MKVDTTAAWFVAAGLLGASGCTTAADLGTWRPSAVNDHGVIVGDGALPGSEWWSALKYKNGTLTALSPLPEHTSSVGTAIANDETVVGSSGVPLAARHAVFWDASGAIHDLGQLIPGWDTYATAINDAGVIIGQSLDEGMQPHAWVFDPAVGTLVELRDPNVRHPWVMNINDRGDIVGCIQLRTPSPVEDVYELRAAKWAAGTYQVTPLAMPSPGSPTLSPPPCARDINESGVIVGEAAGAAVLWRPGNSVVVLPIGDHHRGTAKAINDSGVVVGEGCDLFGHGLSCLNTAAKWELDGRFVELAPRPDVNQWPPDAGGTSSAVDINNGGMIIGYLGSTAKRFE